MLLSPAHALDQARRWQTVAHIGGARVPMMAVDLRGLERSFRRDDQDTELATLLASSPWVNVAVADADLDPVFDHLADAFDVIIGQNTTGTTAVNVSDLDQSIAELATAIQASPQAAVALVQLLRISHDLSVSQALHAESLTYAVLQTSAVFQRWLAKRPNAEPGDPTEQAVSTELVGSSLRITLRRPDKRNALNVAMRDELIEALEWVDLDHSIDGAILQGAGSNFCAGGDLDEFGTTPSPAIGHYVRTVRSLPALMHRVRNRVRVHVHGSCVGAGIEIPAFTAAIIADPATTFCLPEIAFGLVPGAGGTVSVTRRCGRHRTAWLALTGSTINAEQALQWQLIDRISPQGVTPHKE